MNIEVGLVNPFPGLRAFEEEEDVLFFGREKQVDELLRKLRLSRFLAIIGSSGSGKSSLVKSGLLPSLHSGLMSGAGSQWRIALFRPGNDPIGELNKALAKNGVLRDDQSEEELETNTAINEVVLRRSNLGLIESYKQSGLDKRNNLLVLVDQFEELFRFSKYEKDMGDGKRDSVAFINLLLKAAEQKEYPIYVVFTMRSDFLGDCTAFRGLPEAINEGQYLVPRMTREERREAITGPIAVAGGAIAPALVNRLLNDVGDNPDQLPILQHAMMRTWDEWKAKKDPDEPIDTDDYENIGTISEALSQHAEEAYAELPSDKDRQLCESILKELTDKGGLSSGIRRPRLVSELAAAAGVSTAEVVRVIEIFRKPGRGFLMPAYPVPLTDDTIVDISHESIMRVWKRLITWLEEEEEAAQVYLHLCEAVELYESGKGGLWRDPELQIAIKWKEEQNKNAAWASRYNNYFDKVILFLEHSRVQRDREIKHKEELQKQRMRTTRRISIAVSIIALLAFIFGVWAWELKIQASNARAEAVQKKNEALIQKQKADANRRIAEEEKRNAEVAKDSALVSKEKAIKEEKNAIVQKGIAETESRRAKTEKNNADRSAQEALASKKVAEENAERAERNRQEAEKNRLNATLQKEKAEKLRMVAESKNFAHKAMMYSNDSEYAKSRDMSLTAYRNNVSNDGNFQDDDIYNALYLSWQNTIQDKNSFHDHNAPVRSLAFIPGTGTAISGDETGRIIVSDNRNGLLAKKYEYNAGGNVRAVVTDATGGYALVVMLRGAVLYRINSDHSLKKLSSASFTGMGKHGAFIDGKYFLVQTGSGVFRYDISNAAKMDSVNVPECAAMCVAKDGRIFIGAVKTIYGYGSWAKVTGKPDHTYDVPNHVTSLSLDKTGKYLAAGTYSGGIWLKDLNSNDAADFHSGIHKSAVNDLRFCDVATGKCQLASASSDKTVKMTEFTTDHTLNFNNTITVSDHSKWVYTIAYSPDGRYLFSGGEDASVIGMPTTMKNMYDALTTNK